MSRLSRALALAGSAYRRLRSRSIAPRQRSPGSARNPSGTTALRPPARVGAPDQPEYAAWVARNSRSPRELAAAASHVATRSSRRLISVLLPVRDPILDHLRLALGSVEAQLYEAWELCIVDDASTKPDVVHFLESYARSHPRVRFQRLERGQHIAGATNVALSLAQGEFVAFLDHDDELTPDALFEVVSLLERYQATDIVYSDHDVISADGFLRHPHFKPDWSPELLLSYMYFGHLKVYRTSLVRQVGGLRKGFEGSADYDLALRLVEVSDRIRHVPKVLYHWRAAPASMARMSDNKPTSFESGRRAVQEALVRRAIGGTAVWPDFARAGRVGMYRVQFPDTVGVPVTIIIPTRDQLALLRSCVESIEEKTRHRDYRILLLDNESREPETLEYLRRSPHRVLRFDSAGEFNFSAMVNFGVRRCETEFFVLLNNDTIVIAPEWLDGLIGYGRLPRVGAVGAKLLYEDGRIQHAGVVLGIHGLTGHAFQPRHDSDLNLEYQGYAHVARNYLAVTAACMLSHKTAFMAIGGFNARDLKVGWNDVDYCLRLREAGYRVVFTPYSLLYHLEAQSRGDHKDVAEIRYMLDNWRAYVESDPFYSPNLSRRDSEFRVQADPDEEKALYYRRYW